MVHATAEIGTPELTQMLATVPDETEETIGEILMDNIVSVVRNKQKYCLSSFTNISQSQVTSPPA